MDYSTLITRCFRAMRRHGPGQKATDILTRWRAWVKRQGWERWGEWPMVKGEIKFGYSGRGLDRRQGYLTGLEAPWER